jgi:hypothetical protein
MTETDLIRDFEDLFLDEFGEDGFYTQDGVKRTIRLIVNRDNKPLRINDGFGSVTSKKFVISVNISRGAVKGCTSIKPKADIVQISLNIGDLKTDFRVAEILSQDNGSWELGLQR